MFKKILNLLSDAATYGSSAVIRQFISFALLPLYTRYLTTGDYGIIAMLGILNSLFIPLANLGITNAIFRRFNLCKEPNERKLVLSTGLVSLLFSSLFLFLLGQLWAGELTSVLIDKDNLKILVRISLCSAILLSIGQGPLVVLRAKRQVRLAAFLNVISFFTTVIATIYFVVVMRLGVLGVVTGALIGELMATSIAFGATWKQFSFKLDLNIWKSMLSYGLPFLPHRVQSVGLTMFGQYIVWEMLGGEQAGLYNIAMKFAMPVQFVVTSIQSAWVPIKFQAHAEGDDAASFFSSTTVYYVAGISFLWVMVSLWGADLVRLMTAPEFHDAASLVSALSLVFVCQGLYFMFGTGFEFTQNTKPAPLISFSGLITLVSFSFFLIPLYGAMGAAMATVIAWLVMTLIVYLFARKRYLVPHDWNALLAIGVMAIIFVYIGSLCQSQELVFRIISSLFLSTCYPLIAFGILMTISKEQQRLQIVTRKFLDLVRHGKVSMKTIITLAKERK